MIKRRRGKGKISDTINYFLVFINSCHPHCEAWILSGQIRRIQVLGGECSLTYQVLRDLTLCRCTSTVTVSIYIELIAPLHPSFNFRPSSLDKQLDYHIDQL